jgi:hypothetical protein
MFLGIQRWPLPPPPPLIAYYWHAPFFWFPWIQAVRARASRLKTFLRSLSSGKSDPRPPRSPSPSPSPSPGLRRSHSTNELSLSLVCYQYCYCMHKATRLQAMANTRCPVCRASYVTMVTNPCAGGGGSPSPSPSPSHGPHWPPEGRPAAQVGVLRHMTLGASKWTDRIYRLPLWITLSHHSSHQWLSDACQSVDERDGDSWGRSHGMGHA